MTKFKTQQKAAKKKKKKKFRKIPKAQKHMHILRPW